MNNLLASFFTPSQTVIIIAVAALGVILIILNVVLWYVFHKRGERKLYDRLLQKQRELLMQQLDEMREKGDTGTVEQQAFFTNTVYVQVPVPVPAQEVVEETASVVVEEVIAEPTEEVVEQPSEDTEEADTVEDGEENEEDFAGIDDDSIEVEEVEVINGRKIRYNRSFTARIIQGTDELKERYSELKNYILSYNGVKNRISWKHETFRIGRNTFARMVVRGKTLCVCLATDPGEFYETKYKVVDLSIRSPKTKFPCLYRVSSSRKLKYAKELVDMIMSGLGAAQAESYSQEDYKLPYQCTAELIEEGLIKVTGEALPDFEAVKPEEAPAEVIEETASALAEEVVEEPTEEPAEEVVEEITEEAVEEVVEEPTEEPVEEVAEEITEEPVEEVVEEFIEEPVEEVVEEITEAVEEVVEEITEEPVEEVIEEITKEVVEEEHEDDVLPERDFEILAEVDVAETDAISDSDAEQLVEVKVVKKQKISGKKKGIVNIDSLSKNYEAGAHVTIDNLHEKGLVAKEVKVIKVLAKGVLNKPLIVEADDFSLEAVKMIVLTGGRVIRRKISE